MPDESCSGTDNPLNIYQPQLHLQKKHLELPEAIKRIRRSVRPKRGTLVKQNKKVRFETQTKQLGQAEDDIWEVVAAAAAKV